MSDHAVRSTVSVAPRAATRLALPAWIALALMVASGFAGLGLQIVWTQASTLWLGHETAAVLAVVAAFFGGLALGALLLGERIERSERPAAFYAVCEAVIAGWTLFLAFFMAPVSEGLLALIGADASPARHWIVAMAGTFLLFAPATIAMGATLPAMERAIDALREEGASVARLYAANTFGATLGALLVAFWLVPTLGLARTSVACAALNLLCAVVAFGVLPSFAQVRPRTEASRSKGAILAMLAVTGLLGIGYEVLAVRVLGRVTENTVYTFSLLLAVYLVGTAAGAASYARSLARRHDEAGLRDALMQAVAFACCLGIVGLATAPGIKAAVIAFGPGMGVALAAEACVALAAFLAPAFAMGMLFCHLAGEARRAGASFATALGVNTLGAALAPAIVGVGLVPIVGAFGALAVVAAGYVLLTVRRAHRSLGFAASIAMLVALVVFAPSLDFVDVPPGGRLLRAIEGSTASVSVIEDAAGVRRLYVDNGEQEGASDTRYADARQALIPLLAHPAPRRALFLGLGTGVTALSAAEDSSLEVTAVELLPEVVEASAAFREPFEASGATDRLRVKTADARRFVRASTDRFDVIVSDNFHPARRGAGSLYTVEHFRAVRGRLDAGGVFCQWLPLHQLDADTLRSIVAAFVSVYPNAFAVLATYSLDTPVVGLVATRDDTRFDRERLRERLASARAREAGFADDLAFYGTFIAGPRALAVLAADAPINTDDRPIVAYRAPRFTYAPEGAPRDRLVALLREVSLRPEELAAVAPDDAWGARLAAYWRARDRFIEVGRDVRPSGDVRRMLAQVREPLLSIVRASPDFRPAYDPLLRMALALAKSDADEGRALLAALAQAQPARSEAIEALRSVSAAIK